MNWEELKARHEGEIIHVLGASKMMDNVDAKFFEGRICVGCNFVYKKFPVQYTVTRHWKVVKEWIGGEKPSSVLVHPDYTNDCGGFYMGQVGTVFNRDDLIWTRSIIGTAIDLARYMGASKIVIWGVEHSNEYMNGYTGMDDDKISTMLFNECAKKQFSDTVDLMRLKYNIEVLWL